MKIRIPILLLKDQRHTYIYDFKDIIMEGFQRHVFKHVHIHNVLYRNQLDKEA